MSHTFNNPNKDCITGSDYIKSKRRKVKYKTLSKNKSNIEYQKYDNTYNLVNCSNGNGYVKSAKSYDDLLDITVGKHLINPVLNGSASSNYDSWLSSFITVEQTNNDNNIVTKSIKKTNNSENNTIEYNENNKIGFPDLDTEIDNDWGDNSVPGFVYDPNSNRINNCRNIPIQNLPYQIKKYGKIDYKNTTHYWNAVKDEKMSGFFYPTKVNLQNQHTLVNTTNNLFQPLPSQINDSLNKDQYDTWCNDGNYKQDLHEQSQKTEKSRTNAESMNEATVG
jgi:hypothetical protein